MPFVSPLVNAASEAKAMKRPSAEIDESSLPSPLFTSLPFDFTLIRFVLPVLRSVTDTSASVPASPPVNLPTDSNATNLPLPEVAGLSASAFTSSPFDLRLTRLVLGVTAQAVDAVTAIRAIRQAAIEATAAHERSGVLRLIRFPRATRVARVTSLCNATAR